MRWSRKRPRRSPACSRPATCCFQAPRRCVTRLAGRFSLGIASGALKAEIVTILGAARPSALLPRDCRGRRRDGLQAVARAVPHGRVTPGGHPAPAWPSKTLRRGWPRPGRRECAPWHHDDVAGSVAHPADRVIHQAWKNCRRPSWRRLGRLRPCDRLRSAMSPVPPRPSPPSPRSSDRPVDLRVATNSTSHDRLAAPPVLVGRPFLHQYPPGQG